MIKPDILSHTSAQVVKEVIWKPVQAYYAEYDDQAEVEEVCNAQSDAEDYAENAGPVHDKSACVFTPMHCSFRVVFPTI